MYIFYEYYLTGRANWAYLIHLSKKYYTYIQFQVFKLFQLDYLQQIVICICDMQPSIANDNWLTSISSIKEK